MEGWKKLEPFSSTPNPVELEKARTGVIKAVKAWREAKCQKRCDGCDPSFNCFAKPGDELCRKPMGRYCQGENHLEGCPVEQALQDIIAAHNHLELIEMGYVPMTGRSADQL